MMHRRRQDEATRPNAAIHETVTLPKQLGGHAGITLTEDPEIHGGALAVQHVHPNDLAARAGIRPGDVLCAINDVPVTTAAAAVATMDASKEPLVLTYLPAEVANAERQASREHGDRPSQERLVTRVLIVVLLCCCIFFAFRPPHRPGRPGFEFTPLSIEERAELNKQVDVKVEWLNHELRELDPRAALYVTKVMSFEVEYYKEKFAQLEPHHDEGGAPTEAIEGGASHTDKS